LVASVAVGCKYSCAAWEVLAVWVVTRDGATPLPTVKGV
jgi:hypothetical protein